MCVVNGGGVIVHECERLLMGKEESKRVFVSVCLTTVDVGGESP